MPKQEVISEKKEIQQDTAPKKAVNKFLQKALDAQKEKAQNETPPQKILQEKPFPIHAENILPEEVVFDYSEDEAELKAQKTQPLITTDLFADSHTHESEKQEINWNTFIQYCEENGFTEEHIPFIGLATPILTEKTCYLKVVSGPTASKVKSIKSELEKFLCTFLGRNVKVQIEIIAFEMANSEELREKVLNHPQAQLLINEFGAELYNCYELKHSRKI